jgi:peptide/nickel transport system permease protein
VAIVLVKRLLLALVIVLTAITLLLIMIHAVPGDPVTVMLGPLATPELQAAMREKLGLDDPFIVQVVRFFWRTVTGDLGTDVIRFQPVRNIIVSQLPHTLALVLCSIGWAALVGIPLGCLSAIKRGSLLDRVTGILSVSMISVPYFLVSIYALLIFSVHLRWFPAIGVGEEGDLFGQLHHLVLPAFAVGLGWVGYIARLVRASMLEVMNDNHIRTARSFGLSEWRIVFSYALPLAILPAVIILGSGIGRLFSSVVLAEVIFTRPGLGLLVYQSVGLRNYPVVMGGMLVTTALFVVSVTIADLLSAFIDPRLRDQT